MVSLAIRTSPPTVCKRSSSSAISARPETRPDFWVSTTRPKTLAFRSATTRPSAVSGSSSVPWKVSPGRLRLELTPSTRRTVMTVPAGTVTTRVAGGGGGGGWATRATGGLKTRAGAGSCSGYGSGGTATGAGGGAGQRGAAVVARLRAGARRGGATAEVTAGSTTAGWTPTGPWGAGTVCAASTVGAGGGGGLSADRIQQPGNCYQGNQDGSLNDSHTCLHTSGGFRHTLLCRTLDVSHPAGVTSYPGLPRIMTAWGSGNRPGPARKKSPPAAKAA